MTAESPASDAQDSDEPDPPGSDHPPHPLDDETRQREWDKLFNDYQAEFGAFTEEELAESRKRLFG